MTKSNLKLRGYMFNTIKFNKFSDGRGDLVPIEFGTEFKESNIPFKVKRCYFISAPTNDDGAIRGKHAHYSLEQVIICVHGSFTLDLDDGKGIKESIHLSEDDIGVHIKKGLVWRELRDFSPNCVVLVFASEHYDENDYIHEFSVFKEESLKN